MELLERDALLSDLSAMRAEVQTGGGRFTFVAGEAGVGKSALIRQLAATVDEPATVLWGACDPLSSPRPLGPLLDIAPLLGDDVVQDLRSGDRDQAFDTMMLALRRQPAGTVVVFEDVHWADVATLDFLRFLGRRLGTVDVLVIATYRDEQLDPTHVLRIVLGDLVSEKAVARLSVPPLSQAAVEQLAIGSELDPQTLHEETGGNSFFVTELLADAGAGIPATVSDAILGRVARMSPEAQVTLRAAAVIGTRVEPELITALNGVDGASVDECIGKGMLLANEPRLAFRHELVRQAVLDSIAPRRLAELHAEVLDVLRSLPLDPPPLARLADHAERAGDAAAALEFALAAGDAAAGLKSHREAADQYARGWRFAGSLDADAKVDLLQKLSYECYLTDRLDDAATATSAAIELLHEMNRPLELGDNLRQLARIHRSNARRLEADEAISQSIEVLEAQPPGRELAYAYANLGGLLMVSDQWDDAIEAAGKGLALAQSLGEHHIIADALNTIGVARVQRGDPAGESLLLESLAISLEHNLENEAGRAWANLTFVSMCPLDIEKATKYINAGVEYCLDHDLNAAAHCLMASGIDMSFNQGNWDETLEQATTLLSMPVLSLATRTEALTVVGMIRARRGEPGAWDALDQALELSIGTRELQFLAPTAAARAEVHFLAGELDQIPGEVESAYELAQRLGSNEWIGQLGLWLLRVGAIESLPDEATQPFTAFASGDFAGAAKVWEQQGYIYEAAACRAESDDELLLREAIAVLEPLGARPMLATATRNLRALGVVSIPRGPRGSTRQNPAGLTSRELEVAMLLQDGLRNSDIAERLFLSEKTVGHHVSAVLAKLQVAKRTDAGQRLAELGVENVRSH